MTPIKTIADTLRQSHPRTIAWIEREARTKPRQPEFTDFPDKIEGRPGEWVEVAFLEYGDLIDINGYWRRVIGVFKTPNNQLGLALEGEVEGTLSGFLNYPGEMYYRRWK